MRETRTDRLSHGLIVFVLLSVCFVTLYPMIYVLFASLSDSGRLMGHTGMLWKPYGFHLDAYALVLKNPGILLGYANTLLIIAASLVLSLFATSMAAYVLSRRRVYWNKYMMFFIVFTMFLHGGLIPFYLLVRNIGLMNTLWALIIPFLINTFNLIIMRTVFMAVPESLEESAKMDGANHFVVYIRLIVPLSMPVMAVIGLYYLVERWNGWFYASLFIRNRGLFPLQLVLREILITNSASSMIGSGQMDQMEKTIESIRYATIIVATLPIICLYPFVQRFFEKGVMLGSLKG